MNSKKIGSIATSWVGGELQSVPYTALRAIPRLGGIVALAIVLLASPVVAAELQWDYETSGGKVIPPTASVQKAPTATGQYATIATIPSLPSVYPLQPDAYGWYRILNEGGISNSIENPQPVEPAPDLTALETEIAIIKGRLDAVEVEIAKLAQPPVSEANNISASQLNVDQIEIRGLNCAKISTTGSGLKRIVTCVH